MDFRVCVCVGMCLHVDFRLHPKTIFDSHHGKMFFPCTHTVLLNFCIHRRLCVFFDTEKRENKWPKWTKWRSEKWIFSSEKPRFSTLTNRLNVNLHTIAIQFACLLHVASTSTLTGFCSSDSSSSLSSTTFFDARLSFCYYYLSAHSSFVHGVSVGCYSFFSSSLAVMLFILPN